MSGSSSIGVAWLRLHGCVMTDCVLKLGGAQDREHCRDEVEGESAPRVRRACALLYDLWTLRDVRVIGTCRCARRVVRGVAGAPPVARGVRCRARVRGGPVAAVRARWATSKV